MNLDDIATFLLMILTWHTRLLNRIMSSTIGPPSPKNCPDLHSLGSPFVKSKFDENLMRGLWYEVGVKKDTQPNQCNCQTSYKTINEDRVSLTDKFSTVCFYALVLKGTLQYLFSDFPGIWTVNFDAPLLDRIKFPNVVVEVGTNAETGEYDWMLEFSCDQRNSDEIFYAINMYSRTYEDASAKVALMEATARDFGLGPYIDADTGLHYPDHWNCKHTVLPVVGQDRMAVK
jgi:hypothetical protein